MIGGDMAEGAKALMEAMPKAVGGRVPEGERGEG